MDSRLQTSSAKEKRLSAEGVGARRCPISSFTSPPSPKSTPSPSPTGSKNNSSLDYYKKKVGQSVVQGCENLSGMLFICKRGHSIHRSLRCHSRFTFDCPYCARLWREKAIRNFKKRISQMVFPALVTLTLLKRGNNSLEDLNSLVCLCRKYLRRKGYNIRSFVSCIEPPNHIHAVWDCSYIPQKQLSEVWRTVTGDSFIVDIRKVDKQRWRGAVHYISKYITKISKNGSAIAFSGVHVVNSFGDGGSSIKIRMVCKECGSFFEPLWYEGQVDAVDNDDVDFVELDDYG